MSKTPVPFIPIDPATMPWSDDSYNEDELIAFAEGRGPDTRVESSTDVKDVADVGVVAHTRVRSLERAVELLKLKWQR